MKTLCTIHQVTNRRQLLNGRVEDFTWHLFRNKQGTIAGGTFDTHNYSEAVFVRVPRYATIDEAARLVYPAVGREQPHAVCELDKDTWIIDIQPVQDHHKIPYRAPFNLYEQPRDEAKRCTVAPLMVT